jgi:phenylalanyl-tRNA synthetase beta chain
MKVTYNWLKEFVEIKIPPAGLAEKLTMAGLEVKSIEGKDGDFIFEIEITSNRPDWLSVLGVAREVAAVTGRKLKNTKSHKAVKAAIKNPQRFSIVIEDRKDCPVYTAKIIRNVKVGPSPDWLKKRLELVGCRSVNNVVDITNYVLFELGEPLHAFDMDRLSPGSIIVRRANNNETLLSIDGEKRKLSSDILVIADIEKPVAVAGVMGGKDTEVTESTKNVLLEAAIFDPAVVRRGRQRLGMTSEASYRFERGIDPLIVEISSLRTVELIRELAGGDFVSAETSPVSKRAQARISFNQNSIKRHLGIELAQSKVKLILTSLGFEVKSKTKDSILVNVPSWRQDVKAEIDLMEEIARIHGYDKIPTTLPSVFLHGQKEEKKDSMVVIRETLLGLGLTEAVTHSLIDRKELQGFWDNYGALVEISNPLSQEQELLRPTLMPSLCRAVAYNLRQQQPYVNIFEIARTYAKSENKLQEKYKIGIALCGTKTRWFGTEAGHVQDKAGFLHLKGIADALFLRLGINKTGYGFVSAYEVGIFVAGQKAGVFKRLSSDILGRLDIKHKEVFVAEINLEETLLPLIQMDKKFDPFLIPKYPGISRDMTLKLAENISFEDITATIYSIKEDLLTEAEFKAYYEAKEEAGFKRITVSCQYCSPERTLTEEEVTPVHERIVKALLEKFQAKIC